MADPNITKIKISFFGLKIFMAILMPGIFACSIIFIYLWYFDLRMLFAGVKNSSTYAIIIAVTGLGVTLIIIAQRILKLVVRLLQYAEENLSTAKIRSLKKNIISITPHILFITILGWVITDGLIALVYAFLGQDKTYLIRIFFISTLIGSSLTIIPAYFAIDTIIKNFIKHFFNDIDLQDYSDIKTIPISTKIFNAFLVGGVLPTVIIFLSIYDLNFLLGEGKTITTEVLNKYSTAAIAALVFSIIIPFISALYFHVTLAKPIRKLDKTMKDIDGGNLDIKLKADFTDEVGHIAQGLNNMIERVRESVKVHEELALIEKELDIAERVQCSVLTQPQAYRNMEDYSISVLYRPQNGRVGGDYYNIMRLNDSSLSVFIADATGHGMQAALTTMQIDMMNRQSLHLIKPAERFNFLNEYYVSELKGNNLFTACCVNLYTDHIVYGGAGHPDQYLIREGGDIIRIGSTGKLIGARTGVHYKSEKYDIEKGDVLILFTDGAFEQHNDLNSIYGEERLLENIIKSVKKHGSDLQQITGTLFKNIIEYAGNQGLADDLTIIAVHRK